MFDHSSFHSPAHFCFNTLGMLSVLLCLSLQAKAGIATDGSMGPAQVLEGPQYEVGEELGSRIGNNLYHSFITFNINPGEQVVFSGDPSIDIVVARVTGGGSTIIDGKLQSHIGKNAFFLLNPAGIVFMEGAQIDVPAVFYGSTANSLLFTDGSVFPTDTSEVSSLSIAEPEAFGFSQFQNAQISMDGSLLTLAADQKFALSASQITLNNSRVVSESGQIQLTAVGQQTVDVPLVESASTLSWDNALAWNSPKNYSAFNGTIKLKDTAIDVSGLNGGIAELHGGVISLDNSVILNTSTSIAELGQDIKSGKSDPLPIQSETHTYLETDSLTLHDSWIINDNYGNLKAPPIVLNIRDDLVLSQNSLLGSDSYSGGDAAPVQITANHLLLDQSHLYSNSYEGLGNGNLILLDIKESTQLQNQSSINNSTYTPGHAGNISINSSNLDIISGSYIGSNVYASGNAGTVQITTGNLNINAEGVEAFTGIASDVYENASGHAGKIQINAQDSVQIHDGGIISSVTFAEGNAGDIRIDAGDISLAHNDAFFRTGIFSNAEAGSSGNAGNIEINTAEQLSVTNIAAISSATFSQGDAGDILIHSGDVYLAGLGELYQTGISTNAEQNSRGNAGFIQIISRGDITIYQGARISSSTLAEGHAGQLQIAAKNLFIDGRDSIIPTGILSDAHQGSKGNAGTIQLRVDDQIELKANSLIATNTNGFGDAGEITIQASDLTINTHDQAYFSGISSETNWGAMGHAGNIQIHLSGELNLIQDGRISSTSNTSGNAGNIEISAQSLFIDATDSQFFNISSAAFPDSSGEVGNIVINADNIILDHQAEINIAALGFLTDPILANEHYIQIHAKDLQLRNGSFITSISYGNAQPGSIHIHAEDFLELSELTSITTISAQADGGPIVIDTDLLHIDNSFVSTSMDGESIPGGGNGGDIHINTPALIMQSGFIQANTAAVGASGGNIFIHTDQLITPVNQPLYTGVEQRLFFDPDSQVSVIQAAAPDGINGQIHLTVPELDLSAAILNMDSRFNRTTQLAKNPCKIAPGTLPSSLTWSSQGGVPFSVSDGILLPLAPKLNSTQIKDGTLSQQHSKNMARSTHELPFNTKLETQPNFINYLYLDKLPQPGC